MPAAKTRADLDRELLIMDEKSLQAVQGALDTFLAEIAPHIPETNLQGSETGYTLSRVASQSAAFKAEVAMSLQKIEAKLNPPKPDFNGTGGIGPSPGAI